MSEALTATFDCSCFVYGGGVAIFHIATARVVLCYHPAQKLWFLPKGRRDAGEESRTGAEREGFEESGYRNRVLPLPLRHRQPAAYNPAQGLPTQFSDFVAEPIITELMPFARHSIVQYLMSWYIAETVPPALEESLDAATAAAATPENPSPYEVPEPFPANATIRERLEQEPEAYEPVWHPATGVDRVERTYRSRLVPVAEAVKLLKGTNLQYVVKMGWDCIRERRRIEDSWGKEGDGGRGRERRVQSKQVAGPSGKNLRID